jgi:hypothetical protein
MPLGEWFRSAWHRLPDVARRTLVAQLLAQLTADAGGGVDLPVAELPDGVGIADLAQIAPALPQVRVGVLRRDDHVEIGRVADPGSTAILVPATNPRILEIVEPVGASPDPDSPRDGAVVAVPPTGVVHLSVARTEPIRLRTARGDVYDLAPAHPDPNIAVGYMAADEEWAHWIAWQLTDEGWSVRMAPAFETSAWDRRWPEPAADDLDAFLFVLSPTFIRSPEAVGAAAALRGATRHVAAVRTAPVRVPTIPASADLFGMTERDARQALLNAIDRMRRTPRKSAGRPSDSHPGTAQNAPPFPGLDETFASHVMAVSTPLLRRRL